MPTTVLVTGAGGAIGQVTTAYLLESGYTVVALIRPTDPVPPDVQRVVVGDCADHRVVTDAMRDVDGVIHLAARTGRPFGTPAEMLSANTLATATVCSAAVDCAVRRVIIASSQAAYGHVYAPDGASPPELPLNEDSPLLARDSYGLAKVCDEAVARMHAGAAGLSVLAYRLPYTTTYEAIYDRSLAVAALPDTAASELWSYLLIEDAARAFKVGLEADMSGYQAFNVTAPDTLAAEPTQNLIERFHPTTRVTTPIPGLASPISTARFVQELGFTTTSFRDSPDAIESQRSTTRLAIQSQATIERTRT